MKIFIVINIFLITVYSAIAQQDPEAKKILDRVAEKTKSHTSIQADFKLIIENRRDDKVSKTEGKIKIKGDKYYMESIGSKV
jgi:outer membrane lipoprotein-sorting protein